MKRGPYKEFLKETDSDEIPLSTVKYRKNAKKKQDCISTTENEVSILCEHVFDICKYG